MVAGSKRFGSYIRALRESRRLTLEDVERLTMQEPEPITRSLLSRLENGKARVSALKLMALSRLFRVRLGLLAERLELSHELARLEQEGLEQWPLDDLLARARQAGLAGEIPRALLLYEQAELRALEAGDPRPRARCRIGAARALAAAGRFHAARALLDDLTTEALSPEDRAWTLFLVARVAFGLGQPLLARAAHAALRELPRPWPAEVEAGAPALHAQCLESDGQLDAALEAWLQAVDGARRAGEPQLEAAGMTALAAIERRRGRLAQAADWARRARAVAEARGLSQAVVQALVEESRTEAQRRRGDSARALLAQARRLARKLDLAPELFDVYLELWRLGVREHDQAEARAALRALRQVVRFLESYPPGADDVRPLLDPRGHAEPAPVPVKEARR
ncbi:MAG: helix-turn-helix domain-containing protein [Acidobacteria bacterium]|nr:helix-turn-helix domain-containing protein [Acidobacteriota bacterium]